MDQHTPFLQILARDLLAGAWDEDAIFQRSAWLDRRDFPSPEHLASELIEQFPEEHLPDPDQLLSFLALLHNETVHPPPFPDWGPLEWPLAEQREVVVHPRRPLRWNIPHLSNREEIADFLGLYPGELTWLADVHGAEANMAAGPLRHYFYRWIPKSNGRWRLIEMPKSRLKATQRRLLHHLLNRVPPHEAAHSFRRGRNVKTFALPHCNRDVVLRFDLKDFFPSIQASRVHALFVTLGYPVAVARLLTGLCTNVVPEDACRPGTTWHERYRLRSPHLPQGAPTSPALANLCARKLDARLAGLARSVRAEYTRYADDLAFSGGVELERAAHRFHGIVATIALESGFEINTSKTRVLRRGVRQKLGGVVVNVHPNIRRVEYDRLKAILTNCVRNGPVAENRDGHPSFRSHLLGRISHVAMLNPTRGVRLKALFDVICWDEEPRE